MADFSVEITHIRALEPIPEADFIELAVVGEYRCVVKKGQFVSNQKAAYIPEGSLVPATLLEEMGLTGRLAGKNKNRVKASRFKGCLSQGLVYRADWMDALEATTDVQERLGVTKYEPVIPAAMNGAVSGALQGMVVTYDVENYKKVPTLPVEELREGHTNVFEIGEQIYLNEKTHGTLLEVGWLPPNKMKEEVSYDGWFVISKGLGAKGLAFKATEENNQNLYVRTVRNQNLLPAFEKARHEIIVPLVENAPTPVYVLGEIFGVGVQDLTYGTSPQNPQYRIFDVYVGYPGQGFYLSFADLIHFAESAQILLMPLLYLGPFSPEILQQHTSGKEQISGKELHIREGVVMRPVVEGRHPLIGRKILKSVSEDYLLRKGGTEFN